MKAEKKSLRKFAVSIAVAAVAAASLAAERWYPAPDYQDTPDPIASTRAKKGGLIRFNGSMSPKGYNSYTDNNTYTRMMFALMYETLIGTDSETLDFVPCLARRWAVSEDGQQFTFVIDERARWSDGKPVTAEDVKWTFDEVMKPQSDTGPYKMMFGFFESPEVLDERTIRFSKKGEAPKDWRDLLTCGTMYVMPKHWFEGKDFNKLDLVGAPVTGPYQLTYVEEHVKAEWTRMKTWWRGEFPSCKYVCNFDKILLRYYVSNENAFEALKKHTIDVYPVYTARIMANETRGERFEKNWILKRRVRNHNPVGFQGFAMNMRRFPFDDLRVRQAMAKLIDRETMNRTMMYGEYFLLNSYFTDLYDAENPCENPMFLYDFEGAKKLLEEAGFKKNSETGILEKDGRPFEFTFLSRSPGEAKFLALFHDSLSRLGVKMKIDTKDFAAWMRDMDAFNFEMTWAAYGASVFRSPEVTWKSSEADRKQGSNVVGFKSEKVDEIIAAEKSMELMKDRIEAYREIDALIAEQCPFVLLWQIAEERILYWNKFGMPESVYSRYGDEESVFTYWWYDEDRANELREAMEKGSFLPSVPLSVNFDEVTHPSK